MTTQPQNTGLQPALSLSDKQIRDIMDMTKRVINLHPDDDESSLAAMRSCLNRNPSYEVARPAKAAQGDKAIAALKNAPRPVNMMDGRFTGKYLEWWERDYKPSIAALTPESEGIAGKGDAETLLSEIWHYIVNAKLSGTTPCYDPILERMEKLRCTLARPQEIDVEDIRREMAIAADKKYSGNELFDGPRTVNNPSGLFYIGMKFAIDHLVSSGRLK